MKKEDPFNKITSSMMGITAGIAASSLILGGMSKMFGMDETPKGTVREIMEGVMNGLLSYFEYQIEDLKSKVKKLEKEKSEWEEKEERIVDKLEEAMGKIEELTKKKKKKS